MVNSNELMRGNYLYCDGNGCLLRTTCRRYTEGERIRNSRTEGQWYWTEHCDPETRELYKSNKQ